MNHPHTVGREITLQYLYMQDVLKGKDILSFEAFIEAQQPALLSESVAFARRLVENVLQRQSELDTEIAGVAANWSITRMAAIDRNVLRLGLTELIIYPEISHKIIINEAIELAKRYSSEDAGAFVNGLLDRLRIKLRPNTLNGNDELD
ncbi:MAG: transcription antitermination factor NusB [Planctomycetota bacterium]